MTANENSEILQRQSSLETKIEMHMEQDSKTFDQLRDMHKTHFETSQDQQNNIIKLLEAIKGVDQKATDAGKAISDHVGNHSSFYLKVIGTILFAFISSGVSLFFAFFNK